MIQAVLVNLDGVLVRTDVCHYEAWKQLAHEQGIPFNEDIFRIIAGRKRSGFRPLSPQNGTFGGGSAPLPAFRQLLAQPDYELVGRECRKHLRFETAAERRP